MKPNIFLKLDKIFSPRADENRDYSPTERKLWKVKYDYYTIYN
jgi:hypothetical protein